MMSGAYVLTDTIDKAFDSIFVDSLRRHGRRRHRQGPWLQLRGRVGTSSADPGGDARERFAAVDGVEIATRLGSGLPDEAAAPATGRRSTPAGRRRSAFGIETEPEYDRFNPLNLVEGRWPAGGDEVAVDEGVADDEDSRSSETGSASRRVGPAQEFAIVGHRQVRSI